VNAAGRAPVTGAAARRIGRWAGGAALARLAPRVLGPTRTERLAVQLARAQSAERALAERNRLARELHDSVGHALTVTTLQAGAAARVLDSDPAFVARALEAIAEAGRAALEDLDHVLGLLRDGGGEGTRGPQPDLADLDVLVDRARSAGLTVDVELYGPLAAVPRAISREAYRIVQEGLANALGMPGRCPWPYASRRSRTPSSSRSPTRFRRRPPRRARAVGTGSRGCGSGSVCCAGSWSRGHRAGTGVSPSVCRSREPEPR
jgi:hypothetical protein